MFSHDPLFGEQLSTTQIQDSERRSMENLPERRISQWRQRIAGRGVRGIAAAVLVLIAGVVLVLAAVIPAKAEACGQIPETVPSFGSGDADLAASTDAGLRRHASRKGYSGHGCSGDVAQPVADDTELIRPFG